MNKTVADLVTPFSLRLPPGLRRQLQEEADAARRSLSAEIIFRLERTTFQHSPASKKEAS